MSLRDKKALLSRADRDKKGIYMYVSLSLMSLTVPHGSRGKEQGSKAALSFPCPRLVKLSLNEIILRGELVEI